MTHLQIRKPDFTLTPDPARIPHSLVGRPPRPYHCWSESPTVQSLSLFGTFILKPTTGRVPCSSDPRLTVTPLPLPNGCSLQVGCLSSIWTSRYGAKPLPQQVVVSKSRPRPFPFHKVGGFQCSSRPRLSQRKIRTDRFIEPPLGTVRGFRGDSPIGFLVEENPMVLCLLFFNFLESFDARHTLLKGSATPP